MPKQEQMVKFIMAYDPMYQGYKFYLEFGFDRLWLFRISDFYSKGIDPLIKALNERSDLMPQLVPYGTTYCRGDLTPDVILVLNELQAMNKDPWKYNHESFKLDIHDNVKQHESI